MADSNLRLVSLSVLGGALNGRRHNPEEVVTEILVGSDPDCHLVVDLPGVSPIHARVWADLDQSIVYDTRAPRGLYVNSDRVEGQAPVGEGDLLWLGPPREPDSVCVQFHFAPWIEVLPAGGVAHSAPESPAGTAAGDDDPFFLSEAPGGAFVAPARPAPAVEEPPVEEAALSTAAAPAPEPLPPEALTPEALVAETIADDWAIADAVPAASPTAPRAPLAPPAPLLPSARSAQQAPPAFFVAPEERNAPAPTPAEPARSDEFFVAEEPPAEAAGEVVFVEAEPLPAEAPAPTPAPVFELPPFDPVAEQQPERAPLPPQKAAVALTPPPASAAPVTPLQEAPVEPAPSAAARSSAPEPVPVAPPRPAPRPHSEPSPARRPAPSGPSRPAPPSRRPGPSARPARRPARGAAAGSVRSASARGRVSCSARSLSPRCGFSVAASAWTASSRHACASGQRATLTGSGFAVDPAGNSVVFGDREAKVLQASPTRLEVEVPEAVTESGTERRIGVVVRKGRHASQPIEVAVLQGPRLHGLSPEAAMPGEEVVLAGAGWGPGATVRFGVGPRPSSTTSRPRGSARSCRTARASRARPRPSS